MFKPEVEVIKTYNWKHMNYLMESIGTPKKCDNEQVVFIRIPSPAEGVPEQIQLVCPVCIRSLNIYGNEN